AGCDGEWKLERAIAGHLASARQRLVGHIDQNPLAITGDPSNRVERILVVGFIPCADGGWRDRFSVGGVFGVGCFHSRRLIWVWTCCLVRMSWLTQKVV